MTISKQAVIPKESSDIPQKKKIEKQHNLYFYIVIACLYLVQGLPMGIAFEAMPILLRNADVPLDKISLIPLAALPWVFKFFWASYVENHWVVKVGRRKSWIIPMQILLAISILLLGFIPLTAENMMAILAIVSLASLVSATQDIAVDGLTAERLPASVYAYANALQVGGIVLGLIIGGPILMIASGYFGYFYSVLVLSVITILALLPLIFWREPPPKKSVNLGQAAIKNYFKRENSFKILFLLMSVNLGGAIVVGMIKMVLTDFGWSLQDIGLFSGLGISLIVILGCAIAAIIIPKIGGLGTMLTGLILVGASGLCWVFLAGNSQYILLSIIIIPTVIGGLGIGFTSVGSYTYMMSFSQQGEQPATDFSVFQSGQILGEILISSTAMAIAAYSSYQVSFIFGFFITLIVIIFIFKEFMSTRYKEN